MKIIDPKFKPDVFWARLGDTAKPVLILDYDGTLAPFHTDPARAVPYPEITTLLEELMNQSRTRVVIASGRPARQVRELLDLEKAPEIWGCHGAERLNLRGEYHAVDLAPDTAQALREARAHMEQSGFKGRLEIKPFSLAAHWRGIEEENAKAAWNEARQVMQAFIKQTGLSLHDFDGGLELRPDSITKAHAVETILTEAGQSFVGAYLGDDLTDEDAFAAMGDHGLSVLVRTEFRPTKAQLWLQPPEDLLEFLHIWLESTAS